MADACLYLMRLPDDAFGRIALASPDFPLINIGVGEDLTILELAELVKQVVGFEGEFAWDRSKPDGTLRKLLSVDRLSALGWHARVGLREGIAVTYGQFVEHHDRIP
jgi:GDP-L-fucose synthase